MPWSCLICTFENNHAGLVCGVCLQPRTSDPDEISCPACTLLNKATANECSACDYKFLKETTPASVPEDEDDRSGIDLAERFFDDVVEKVYVNGDQRFRCRYDGITIVYVL